MIVPAQYVVGDGGLISLLITILVIILIVWLIVTVVLVLWASVVWWYWHEGICRVMRHSSWETTRKHYAPVDIQQDAAVLQRLLGKAENAGPEAPAA